MSVCVSSENYWKTENRMSYQMICFQWLCILFLWINMSLKPLKYWFKNFHECFRFQMSCKEKLISFILSKVYWMKWFVQFSLNSIHSFYFYDSYIQCYLPLVLEVSLSFNWYSCFHSRRYIFQKPGPYARVSCRDCWRRNENLTWLNN